MRVPSHLRLLLVLWSGWNSPLSAASPGSPEPAVGWIGTAGDFSGVTRQSTGTWTGRGNWGDVAAVGWPEANPEFRGFVAANPEAVVNFATALIPHGQPSAAWNQLLDEVIAGQHDDVFVQQGQAMGRAGTRTVYCRPWWEMTIDTANLDPARFRKAWNRAVPLIKGAFAAAAPSKTLKIVFCYLPDAAGDPKPFYPGPANVDVIDADVYGSVWGRLTPSLSTLLDKVRGRLDSLAAFAAEQHKPIGISEWGNFAVQALGPKSNQGRGDVPEYIDLMFDFARHHPVLYLIYFNLPDGGVGQTLRDTPQSLARFKAGCQAP